MQGIALLNLVVQHTFKQRGRCTSLLNKITLLLLTNNCINYYSYKIKIVFIKDIKGKNIKLKISKGS